MGPTEWTAYVLACRRTVLQILNPQLTGQFWVGLPGPSVLSQMVWFGGLHIKNGLNVNPTHLLTNLELSPQTQPKNKESTRTLNCQGILELAWLVGSGMPSNSNPTW